MRRFAVFFISVAWIALALVYMSFQHVGVVPARAVPAKIDVDELVEHIMSATKLAGVASRPLRVRTTTIASLGMTSAAHQVRQQGPEVGLARRASTSAISRPAFVSIHLPVRPSRQHAASIQSQRSRQASISVEAASDGGTNSESKKELSIPVTMGKRRSNLPGNTSLVPSQSVSSVASKYDTYLLEPQRWTQLLLLSMLALISDWVCFSTAAVPDEWLIVEGHEASELIDIFLFSNVVSCFFYTDIAAFFGLRKVMVVSAFLMATGCVLRSSSPYLFDVPTLEGISAGLPAYSAQILGTVLVGLAQPYFQCAPPLLSATWFGSSERALATATALNANQLGIATAFIVGGLMAETPAGMRSYLNVITFSASVTAIATALLFRERPLTPPSASTAAEWAIVDAKNNGTSEKKFELTYPKKALALLRNEGFLFPLVAFVASITTTNVVSAFTASELARAGFPPGFDVDLAGAAFQVAIVIGGIGLGRYVDETKQFKTVLLGCLITSIGWLAGLGLSEGNDLNFGPVTVLALLLALGAAVGPVQPISAELGVEVAFPCDENAVEATQQLAGNLFSALMVPICAAAAAYDFEPISNQLDVRGDTLVLGTIVALTATYFTNFNAPLRRTLLDEGSDIS